MDTKQKVLAHALFTVKDSTGADVPANPSVLPVWTIDNPAIATLTPSVDGLSCEVSGLTAGLAVITVTAGSVSGIGKVTVTKVTVTEVAPQVFATDVTITFDTPVAQ